LWVEALNVGLPRPLRCTRIRLPIPVFLLLAYPSQPLYKNPSLGREELNRTPRGTAEVDG